MDIKVMGITPEIMRDALEQARRGRLYILDKMCEVIAAPRPEMSPYAPRVIRMKIKPEQIGEVIGPGGRVIRAIQEQTGSKISIEEDGTVFITAANEDSARRAVREIERLTRVPEVGEIFYGRVVTIIPSGAFVEILPGKDGFLHISEIAPGRVRSVEDVLKVGQEINVMVIGIRPDGKINLSRKALLEKEAAEQAAAATAPVDGRGTQARPPQRPSGPAGRPERPGSPPKPDQRSPGRPQRPQAKRSSPPPGQYRIGDRLKELLGDED
jgi:polyribonucleotide nucleotidyltransferase